MSGRPRKNVIREDVVGVYHVGSRCVRRAWLCGIDPLTGVDYSHRRHWICERMEELARIFAVDACVYAILSNHYHLLVRNRPDLTAQWSDEEVVRRWWQLYPERRNDDGTPAEPTELEIRSIAADVKRTAELRTRLSSISWFMKELNQSIASRANAEDGVGGHFFQERFGCRSLLDERAILVCSLYIDLNEIRAMLATNPEDSVNTSAYRRILARIKRREREQASRECQPVGDYQEGDPDYWLCPVSEQDCSTLLGRPGVNSVEASQGCDLSSIHSASVPKQWRHGFLTVTIDQYLDLLDGIGRQIVTGKRGAIDSRLAPILDRLGLRPSTLVEIIENFDRWFHGAVGSAPQLMQEAARTGRSWIQGLKYSRTVFT